MLEYIKEIKYQLINFKKQPNIIVLDFYLFEMLKETYFLVHYKTPIKNASNNFDSHRFYKYELSIIEITRKNQVRKSIFTYFVFNPCL